MSERIIIEANGVDLKTATACVAHCIGDKKDCVWTFRNATGERIIVFDKQNKNSTRYVVYKEKQK